MNFFDFDKERRKNGAYQNPDEVAGQNKNNCNGKSNAFSSSNEDMLRQKFDEYASKSEGELSDELSEVVDRMRANGTLDIDSLERFYMMSSQFLTDAQCKRMRDIIDQIRRG